MALQSIQNSPHCKSWIYSFIYIYIYIYIFYIYNSHNYFSTNLWKIYQYSRLVDELVCQKYSLKCGHMVVHCDNLVRSLIDFSRNDQNNLRQTNLGPLLSFFIVRTKVVNYTNLIIIFPKKPFNCYGIVFREYWQALLFIWCMLTLDCEFAMRSTARIVAVQWTIRSPPQNSCYFGPCSLQKQKQSPAFAQRTGAKALSFWAENSINGFAPHWSYHYCADK